MPRYSIIETLIPNSINFKRMAINALQRLIKSIEELHVFNLPPLDGGLSWKDDIGFCVVVAPSSSNPDTGVIDCIRLMQKINIVVRPISHDPRQNRRKFNLSKENKEVLINLDSQESLMIVVTTIICCSMMDEWLPPLQQLLPNHLTVTGRRRRAGRMV